jgi:hypothetical protein
MNDLYGRDKFAHLPRSISTEGKHTHTYAVGDDEVISLRVSALSSNQITPR